MNKIQAKHSSEACRSRWHGGVVRPTIGGTESGGGVWGGTVILGISFESASAGVPSNGKAVALRSTPGWEPAFAFLLLSLYYGCAVMGVLCRVCSAFARQIDSGSARARSNCTITKQSPMAWLAVGV
ncbi:hypothetical protein FB45DRAFT_871814 [Roridomyces roridus]|uniref:Uncharacterized protein n=1 Tax=Roridomyces roridus TaxID=1738132 RepID=A0AAD7FH61_9AGAR|nr:hypothetical protein FB45DRAFT_871814 [Roridomyces roridus]